MNTKTLREQLEACLLADIKHTSTTKDKYGDYYIRWIYENIGWRIPDEDSECAERFKNVDKQFLKLMKGKLLPELFVKQLDDQLLLIFSQAFGEEIHAYEKCEEELEYYESEIYLGECVLKMYRYLKYNEKD